MLTLQAVLFANNTLLAAGEVEPEETEFAPMDHIFLVESWSSRGGSRLQSETLETNFLCMMFFVSTTAMAYDRDGLHIYY